MTPKTFEEALDRVLQMQRQVMIERHRKYGPNNMLEAGIIGAINRASQDKIARIRHHYERVQLWELCRIHGMPQEILDKYVPVHEFEDEAIEDAHIDAANYLGPISLMLHYGWWGLPLEADVQKSP